MKKIPLLITDTPALRKFFVKKEKTVPDKNIIALKKSGIVREIRSSAAHIQIVATEINTESFDPKSKFVENIFAMNKNIGKSITVI